MIKAFRITTPHWTGDVSTNLADSPPTVLSASPSCSFFIGLPFRTVRALCKSSSWHIEILSTISASLTPQGSSSTDSDPS